MKETTAALSFRGDVVPEFKDVLGETRIRNYLWWYMIKSFHLKQAFSHKSNFSNPLQFQYKILIDKHIHLLIQEAFPTDSSSNRFYRLICIVKEIGYTKNIYVIRWLGLLLIKIMKKIMQSIFVSEVKLLKLKHRMGKNPVILLPTHRSYADFILMAFICLNYEIEIPVVVAGMDFHAMIGMATLLRQCGAMYMRRSFKEDKIYSAVFKKYIQTVIARGNSPFEFFIEGTRSRCGKSLTPKLGILKMMIEVYLSKEVEDITFVPIAISYDKLLEDSLFVREVLGIPKPKESTTGLLKAMNLLEEQYGNIYINIGDEISLKKFWEEYNDVNDFLPCFAYTLVSRQQENTVVTFFNILSAVIVSQFYSQYENSFKISYLMQQVTKINRLLAVLGAITSIKENIFEELERILRIHKFLIKDLENCTIRILNVHSCGKSKGYSTTTKSVVSLILLQHYANLCYFYLINPTIIIAVLKTEKQLTTNILFLKFKLFRKLFKYEFVFFEGFEHQDFEKSCSKLTDLKILEFVDCNKIVLVEKQQELSQFCCNLLIPYIKGYLFICERLSQISDSGFDESKLKSRIKNQLELELDKCENFGLFYALSSHFISCTFSSLIDANILHLDRSTNCIKIKNSVNFNLIIPFLKCLLIENKSEIDVQLTESFVCKL